MPSRPSFALQIISPTKTMVDTQVRAVVAAGAEGDFGVLKGHEPFFSMLRPGVIQVELATGGKQHFFATSGFADVTPDGCTILSEHIQNVNEVNPSSAQEALSIAQRDLAAADNVHEREAAQHRVDAAKALLAALK